MSSIYHDAPEGTEDARYGGDDGDDVDRERDEYFHELDEAARHAEKFDAESEPPHLAEALARGADLRFEPVAPCGECGVDTETYYHLPTCSESEDIVGVGV